MDSRLRGNDTKKEIQEIDYLTERNKMLKHWRSLSILFFYFSNPLYALPPNFVNLSDINPTILQDIKYATPNNFIGRPIKGYQTPKCIVTYETALALSHLQQQLKPLSLSL